MRWAIVIFSSLAVSLNNIQEKARPKSVNEGISNALNGKFSNMFHSSSRWLIEVIVLLEGRNSITW
ncbi:hypothetical protein D3C73_1466110 [compost metagenome]